MSTATTTPVGDDNFGNPLGWVYTLPLPSSQGGEVYKFTYGFVSCYSYLRVEAELADAVKRLKDTDKVTDCMVDRFLRWRLPHDFAPDCGITFDGCKPDALGHVPSWPVGTNLLTSDQARAMIKHIIHGEEEGK